MDVQELVGWVFIAVGLFISAVHLVIVIRAMWRTPTQAVVVDNIEEIYRGQPRWTPVVEFTDHDGNIQRGPLNYHQSPAEKLGTQIPVRYDRNTPESFAQSVRRLLLFGWIPWIFVLIGYVILEA